MALQTRRARAWPACSTGNERLPPRASTAGGCHRPRSRFTSAPAALWGGRRQTAWAAAGILGPVIVNCVREYPPGLGIPHEQACDQALYLLVGMLVIGLVCNLPVRPLADKWFMSPAGLAEEKRLTHDRAVVADAGPGT